MAIQFNLNGDVRREEGLPPTTTVLDYLRNNAGLMGAKEGCAEGDCGACSIVLVRHEEDGKPVYEAVNSCLLMLPQMDGRTIVTVEGLQSDDGLLDPVQDAMVQSDGTQCGFCTPGFIMALYALRQGDEPITDGAIHDALAGNLCRCTGYRPIVEAARAACGGATP
ncbi:MAG: 2Fe-2S iron-sulfur cluster binding domain-containing protein, partial [Rhodospirillales bacterium]|nr:2Fe-2S iron-sulfur cluster binding domain-containing protein [Rhodospirillales bacterium]